MSDDGWRSLYVVLSDESRALVRSFARLPEVRGDHVTLAFRVEPGSDLSAYVFGGHCVGDQVEVRAVAEHDNGLVQAWLVELDGTSQRRLDGGKLHVTVSRSPEARSRDANDLLVQTPGTPISRTLTGRLEWVAL